MPDSSTRTVVSTSWWGSSQRTMGLRTNGSRVNGRIAPLSRELKNGDTVEIMTDAKQRPSRDWLAFVKSTTYQRGGPPLPAWDASPKK